MSLYLRKQNFANHISSFTCIYRMTKKHPKKIGIQRKYDLCSWEKENKRKLLKNQKNRRFQQLKKLLGTMDTREFAKVQNFLALKFLETSYEANIVNTQDSCDNTTSLKKLKEAYEELDRWMGAEEERLVIDEDAITDDDNRLLNMIIC